MTKSANLTPLDPRLLSQPHQRLARKYMVLISRQPVIMPSQVRCFHTVKIFCFPKPALIFFVKPGEPTLAASIASISSFPVIFECQYFVWMSSPFTRLVNEGKVALCPSVFRICGLLKRPHRIFRVRILPSTTLSMEQCSIPCRPAVTSCLSPFIPIEGFSVISGYTTLPLRIIDAYDSHCVLMAEHRSGKKVLESLSLFLKLTSVSSKFNFL
mmetsp:Transcript_11397/g.31794  ORF Transcript_11397/g.31794 Transcript_11397/m.31794 type:complete len:213 (+) Transcript_11397:147-785(+)